MLAMLFCDALSTRSRCSQQLRARSDMFSQAAMWLTHCVRQAGKVSKTCVLISHDALHIDRNTSWRCGWKQNMRRLHDVLISILPLFTFSFVWTKGKDKTEQNSTLRGKVLIKSVLYVAKRRWKNPIFQLPYWGEARFQS